jgi:hypothetical protein
VAPCYVIQGAWLRPCCERIGHRSSLFHGDFLNSLDITDLITKGIDDLHVLDVWDSVPSIVEMFLIISEAFIMLLLDSL